MRELRNLDLNLLVMFEAVYTNGNITHAAKSLGVTQPTISNALVRMREQLDDQLFVRKGKGVEPTAKAIALIEPVREALQVIKNSISEDSDFDPEQTKTHFRIVMLDQLEPVLMPSIVKQIQKHRAITLEMLPIGSTDFVTGLKDETLDLVISPHFSQLNNPEFETAVVGEADVVIIARKDHPEISGKVSLEQFQSIGQIALIPKLRTTTRVDEYLKQHDINRHIVYTSAKFWAFPHMVAKSELIGLVPRCFAREAARYYPLQICSVPFEFPEQQMYMIWKSSRSNEPALKWLRNQMLVLVNQPSS